LCIGVFNKSMGGGKQNILSSLQSTIRDSRLLKFCIVGTCGVIVNMGVLYILSEFAGLPYFISSLAAIELSIISNFVFNHLWTWSDRTNEVSVLRKLIRYHLGVAGTAYLWNYLILVGLTEWLGIQYLISNLAGIGAGTIANYLISDRWTFKKSTGFPLS
jgi:dolichol-phosphate mannosyltransferase